MKEQKKPTDWIAEANKKKALSITGREFMEQALRESEEKFFRAFRHSPALMGLSSLSTDRLIDVNEEFLRVFEYSREEVIGKTPSYLNLFVSPRQRAEIAHKLREKGRVQNEYVQAKTKTGKIIDLLWSGESIPIGDREYLISSAMDITERKRAENKLLESEARYRSIFENMQDVYYEVAFDGKILEVSPGVAKVTAYQRKDIIGSSIYNFYELREQRAKLLDLLLSEHKVTDYEIHLTDKNGSVIPCSISSQLIFDSDGKPLKIVGTIRSIAERKKMEQVLRASEKRFKTAFYTSPDAISINRLEDGLYVDINEGFTGITGFSREDVMGRTAGEINIWRNPADRQELIRGLKEKGYYENLEAEFCHKDGSIHTSLMSAKIIELQNELHLLSITREISDRKKAESRQVFVNQLLELINSGYEPDDSIGRIALLIKEFTDIEAIGLRVQEDCDFPYYETRGFPDAFIQAENSLCSRDEHGEIIRDTQGDPYLECMCGNILKGRINSSLPFFTAGGSFWSNNTTKLLSSTSDGDRRTRTRNRCNGEGYQSVALIPLRSGEHIIGLLQFNDKRTNRFTLDMIEFFEKIGAAIGIALHRKQAADKLKKEEERYRTVADFTYDWEYWMAEDGSYLYISPSMERVTGYGADELISNPALLEMMIHPDDRQTMIRHVHDPGNHPCPFDFRIIRKNGGERWIAHRCQHVHDASGKALGWRGSNRDITERKMMEAQLIQSQKMEAIGTLAGGIAHDFNNILGAIIGYAEIAQDEIPAESGSLDCVEQILKAGERAKYLVQQILAFSRHTEVENKLLMIVPLIKEVVKLLRHALPATISIKEDLRVKDGYILADPTQIHQVLMNLCTNAGHAMREHGGTLTIGLKQMAFTSDRICGHDQLKAGSYLELKVADTGHGIDPSIVDHIFEPFFTTKQQGEGTGMGLSIVYGIIKSCDGSISVESQVGVQTTFTIYLPSQYPMILPQNDQSPKEKAGGKENILLVEDRDDMLRMMNSMLSRLGYGVTAKQNSLEAVALFRDNPAQFDMIITDQTMPHLTGADMAKEVLSIRPNMPIILCTGFSDLISSEDAKAMGICEYMSKPITTRELARTIRNIFDHNKTESGKDLKSNGQSSDN